MVLDNSYLCVHALLTNHTHQFTFINYFGKIYTVRRFRLLQPCCGHLSCIPFVCMTHEVQGMLYNSNQSVVEKLLFCEISISFQRTDNFLSINQHIS